MTNSVERADARRNREAILAAADRLFASAPTSHVVSMDEVAAAAGVGKGTLFRRFGDRDGLLHSLIAEKQKALLDAAPPTGSGAIRVRALVDALLTFKLDNRYLMLAVESVNNPYASPQYSIWHDRLRSALIGADVQTGRASFVAHALLAAVRSDLIEYLLTSGSSARAVKTELAVYVDALLPGNDE